MNGRFARLRGIVLLLVWLTGVGIVWLVVLPHWSRDPETAAYLDELDRRGIDPSALFYTDLPMMDDLLRRIEK